MSVQITPRILAMAIIAVAIVGAASTVIALGGLSNNKSIQSYGTVKAVNIGVYWNSGCTNVTSTINWGTISPGSSKDIVLYLKNEGNVAVTLSLSTQNWSPSNTPTYIALSWNKEGQVVNSGSVVTATLTLSVSSSISGITSFSFDIIVTGSES